MSRSFAVCGGALSNWIICNSSEKAWEKSVKYWWKIPRLNGQTQRMLPVRGSIKP
jgi:hypothetical protein